MSDKMIFDEKLVSLFQKIKVPKNPLSFYLNLARVEKDLSEGLRDYFYRAINEFITISNEDVNPDKKTIKLSGYSSFLLKLYYYTGFTKNIADDLNNFLQDLKFYDVELYLKCAVYFDSTMKYKILAILNDRVDILEEIAQVKSRSDRQNLEKKYEFLKTKLSTGELLDDFEKKFYSIKDKRTIDLINKYISVDPSKNPLSYSETHLSYTEYQKSSTYWQYQAVMFCFSHIVSKYNRYQKYDSLLDRIFSNYQDFKIKISFFHKAFSSSDKYKVGEYFHKHYEKYFSSRKDFQEYLVTYLLNSGKYSLKQFFYWEAISKRLSENEWALMGGANLFYLQKIDENIADFNMLLFFKQFKDTLIDLYNSLFWPFIKPYFYYILVFKAIKLPLKDWQKFFFLLMFFSAESYEEYIILQNIYKSIENIGIWNQNAYKHKLWFYIERALVLLREFFSSIVLTILFVILLWLGGFLNIIMLTIVLLLLFIGFAKYVFFPGRFEILRSFTLIMVSILAYVWFTTVFPKITDPKYFTYLGSELQSLVSLDFKNAKENYYKMIAHIYGDNYKDYEKKLLSSVFSGVVEIKNNEKIKKLVNSSLKVASSVVEQYTAKYVSLKKGEYLKLIVDREIDKLIPGINSKDKAKLSKLVVKEYIKWYCSIKKDYYCKTGLETLPVGFKINLTKIDELIKKLEGKIR